MTITAASLKASLPEFASISDAVVEFWLATCAKELNGDRWGESYDDGHLFLTAHSMVRGGVLASNAGSAQPSGPLASVTIGSVSKSYAVASGDVGGIDGDLELTAYGKIFKRKMRSLMRSPVLL